MVNRKTKIDRFTQLTTANLISVFFFSLGWLCLGFIFPTIFNAFHAGELECVYNRYFLRERKSLQIALSVIAFLIKVSKCSSSFYWKMYCSCFCICQL